MTTSRDEEGRAGAYLTSSKPLFQARKIERKFFSRSRVPGEQLVTSPGDSPSSRIPLPRKTSSPRAITSLRDAYAIALREEEDGLVPGNESERNAGIEGSPSPAPRPRPIGSSQRERDEQRIRRLREGMQVVTGSPLGHNGEKYLVSPTEDDNTIGSNGSGGSAVSPEEEFTDQWLNEMKQAADDQRRVTAALNSQNKLFTRGGLGTRVTETAQTLVRKSSASSLDSEPGVRIPRTWGRHAKKNPGWLNRISSPESSQEVVGHHQEVVSEGPIDWVGVGADAPLPSVENGSPVQEPTPPHSRPNSAQLHSVSVQKSHIWDPEFDFTAQSVQESTSPQLKVKNTKLDEIRAREIQALSKRAVATARLEEIKERNSTERSLSPDPAALMVRGMIQRRKSDDADRWVRQRFHSASDAEDGSRLETLAETATAAVSPDKTAAQDPERKVVDEVQKSTIPAGKETLPKGAGSGENELFVKHLFVTESHLQDNPHEKTILDEEGEAIPGTPITIFKSAAATEKFASRPGHSREDSWETLRKLSRIASVTPSPANGKLAERPSDESLQHLNRLSADVKRLSGASTPPKSDIDPEERIVSEVSLFELQDDKPERNSLRTPSPAEYDGVDETPRPRADPLTLPTPIVTGAYIDTPAPRGRQPMASRPSSPPLTTDDKLHNEVSRICLKDLMRGSSSHSNMSRKEIRASQRDAEHGASHVSSGSIRQPASPKPRRRSRPPLTNSAHPTSVEDDLRAIQVEAEDSTLDDFDGLVLAETEDIDPKPPTIRETDDRGQPLSTEEFERRREMLAIERMNKTIKSGLVSIRDAKRGIERLEDQVSSTSEPLNHNHDQHSCLRCASDSTKSSFHYLSVPIPRLWSRDLTKWTGVRFTWIGVMLLLLTTWLLLESASCELYCHPQYASTNDWSPQDPFWGGAIPFLLNRLTGGVFRFFFNIILGVFAGGGVRTSNQDVTWAEGGFADDEIL